MKKKLIFIALIACVLLAFTFTACEEVDEGDDGVAKTLVVTGINVGSGNISVGIANKPKKGDPDIVAVNKVAYPTNADKSVTIPLVSTTTNVQFTGTGNFYIILIFEGATASKDDDLNYFYTGGGLLPLTYNLTEATSTIPFAQFAEATE